jgi:hypothetical protein
MKTWCNGNAADTYLTLILRRVKHHGKLTFRQAVDDPRMYRCLYTRTTNRFSPRRLIFFKIRFNIISPTEEFLPNIILYAFSSVQCLSHFHLILPDLLAVTKLNCTASCAAPQCAIISNPVTMGQIFCFVCTSVKQDLFVCLAI